jgi:hypothetical protein
MRGEAYYSLAVRNQLKWYRFAHGGEDPEPDHYHHPDCAIPDDNDHSPEECF